MKIAARYVVALLAIGWQAHAWAQQATQPAAALGGPGASSNAPFQTGYVDLLLGMGYTDNALMGGSRHKGDGIGTAGFSVDYLREGGLSLNLLGDLARVEYVQHSLPGSFYGHFLGSALLGTPSDVLQWQLRDTFGEGTTDPLAAPTPANLQTINDVSTGPLVNLHFGLTNRLTFSGLYSRTTYQRSPYDSQTYLGGVQFVHALSGASSLSFAASDAHTKYIDSAAVQGFFRGASSTYDIRQASVSYRAHFVRTRVLLRGGYNILHYAGGATHGSPLYALRISRRISPFSSVFLGAQEAYSTNGGALASSGAQIGLQMGASVQAGIAVAQPFNRRSVDAGWNFQRARTNLSVTGSYAQETFNQTSATNAYNNSTEGAMVAIGRQLRPTVMIQLRLQGYLERYSSLGAQSRRYIAQLTFSKHFARTTFWIYAERSHQSGAPGISTFQATSYNDDRVGVYVTYDLFGQRPIGSSLVGMPSLGGFGSGY